MSLLVPVATTRLPALVAAADDRAQIRFLEFFAAAIRNPHTRRAYARAVVDFLGWCKAHGVPSIAAVQPLHGIPPPGAALWRGSSTVSLCS